MWSCGRWGCRESGGVPCCAVPCLALLCFRPSAEWAKKGARLSQRGGAWAERGRLPESFAESGRLRGSRAARPLLGRDGGRGQRWRMVPHGERSRRFHGAHQGVRWGLWQDCLRGPPPFRSGGVKREPKGGNWPKPQIRPSWARLAC